MCEESQMLKALDLRMDFKETIRRGIANIYLNANAKKTTQMLILVKVTA